MFVRPPTVRTDGARAGSTIHLRGVPRHQSAVVLPLLLLGCCWSAHAAGSAPDSLAQGFLNPPDEARPRVWWHWMNGNVTEAGIRLDLEWMKRIGVGGVQNFDAGFQGWGPAFDTPVLVADPLVYLSPGWQRALRYSVSLADQEHLEFAIASSAGFSETGGPWVKPPQAMKKLVWSETYVEGGKRFKGVLVRPPETTGSFQNIPVAAFGGSTGVDWQPPVFYSDVATIAYRLPRSVSEPADGKMDVTSSSGPIDSAALSDRDLGRSLSLPFGSAQYAWIQFSFPKPRRIQALTMVVGRPASWEPLREPGPSGWLEAGDEGGTFRKVADLPLDCRVLESCALEQTIAFAQVTAPVFRVVFRRPDPPGMSEQLVGLATPAVEYKVAELVLHSSPRVNRFEDKAGYSTRPILERDDTPAVADEDVVHKGSVIDLTNRVRPDGYLDWTPPAGHWMVQRFGYSLIGTRNHPAPSAGTGLEVDKLNRECVREYTEDYLKELERALGPELIGERGLRYVVTDSYEAGPQNWTADMLAQFSRRRGYDALPWLAVLAGHVVESAGASDRFLWDFRKTLGELMTEAHYGQFSASLRQRGLGRYGESHEHLRAFIGDGMEAKKTAAIPMGAMWAAGPAELTRESSDADIRESASVAHIYGQNLVAAESFTAYGNPYGFAPETLRPIADRELAMGLNRFVIHTSVHQPDETPGPGIGLGPIGQWFTRKETWAEQAGGWMNYLARSSYLLQQGRFVADIAYFYGEDTNVTALFNAREIPVPSGYNFDFVNADALMNELSVRSGRLVTRSGMEYRLLVLDDGTRRVSLPTLRRIRDLVLAGAVVVGSKPMGTPSLADDVAEFHAIAAQLWGPNPGTRTVGLGRVIGGQSIADALQALQIPQDFAFANPTDGELRYVHRALDEGEIYFVSNGTSHARTVEGSFRVTGKEPELWKADTGSTAPVSFRVLDGRTIVPLELEANEAVFVVFRKAARAQTVVVAEPEIRKLADIEGSWEVTFPPGLGAPARIHLERLYSWTESTDDGVRYFSGSATYRKNIIVAPNWLRAGSRVQLDLGEVKNVAEVTVNSRSVGSLWKSPFRIDITDSLVPGQNRLEIKISNLWPNRLIGDKQPGAHRIAFATFDSFKADSPLMPSGLLGPVTVLEVTAPPSTDMRP